ncbi:MAG: serine/threonine protein kinase [Deltaproteobacteria bacterium]|nr:serine/threonine protein kinase [Deltaproteobacteria bacterium]
MDSIEDYTIDHLLAEQVGTATIIGEIARGGMGIVLLAYQRTLKRRIAVKILPKLLLDEATRQRFQLEAEAAANLSHPNIIPIYEVGETDEFLFFTMQLVQGEALSDILQRTRKHFLPSRRTLPLMQTITIISQILDALDYAHRQGVIHQDIKPGNILIERNTGRTFISDFGLAKVLRGEEIDSCIRGTPVYMAPEQIKGADTDGRADIYSVGIMLLEMLVPQELMGSYDSTGDFLKAKMEKGDALFSQRPSELNSLLHPEMDTIIRKATTYNPMQRYATCMEFRNAIDHYGHQYLNANGDRT